MRRRDFIRFAGGTALLATSTLRGRAQPSGAMPVVGILSGANLGAQALQAVADGLQEGGFIEGQNVAIERRDADGRYDLLPAMVADLVGRHVAAIIAIGGTQSVAAAKAGTTTIPIVFANGGDPVRLGFVSSLNRPGGNVTGISFLTNTLGAKRMQLLHTLLPSAVSVGVLANPQNPNMLSETADILAAASSLGQHVSIIKASTEPEIDTAFVTFKERQVNALSVVADGFFNSRRDRFAALEIRYSLPAIFAERLFAVAGGLMSYGASVTAADRFVGIYAARILKGEKPGDLPVQQATKTELIVNLKTAKALGLTVPPTLLAIADEVIE